MIFIIIISLLLTLALYCCCISAGRADKEKRKNKDESSNDVNAVQRVGVNVDKDELIKALQYDRGQYDKGYADGYKEAIRKFSKKLKEHCNEITNQEWNKKTSPVSWADAYEGFIDDIDRLLEETGCNDG